MLEKIKNDNLLTRVNSVFVGPNVNTVYKGGNSLRYFGPIVWNNMLPDKTKVYSSLFEFKKCIKSWVP